MCQPLAGGDLLFRGADVAQKGQLIQHGFVRLHIQEHRGTAAMLLLRSGTPDVATLRGHFQLSQAKFAALLGISVDTLQNWEQGRRQPEGPARVLLRVAAAHPEALLSVTQQPPKRRVS